MPLDSDISAYVIPDVTVLMTQSDWLHHPSTRNIILLQSVLRDLERRVRPLLPRSLSTSREFLFICNHTYTHTHTQTHTQRERERQRECVCVCVSERETDWTD